jgi:hypothetical protein
MRCRVLVAGFGFVGSRRAKVSLCRIVVGRLDVVAGEQGRKSLALYRMPFCTIIDRNLVPSFRLEKYCSRNEERLVEPDKILSFPSRMAIS